MRQGGGVHFIGLDLAWGEKRPTGVAVLDDEGHLLELASWTTDEEIVEALGTHVDGECLVAVDAPLIVVNPTGNRPCEAALNADFGRFEAGCHPANTGKPEFASGSRAARLCDRLDLDLAPTSGSSRRAIEVYPHPATIALFALGRTLKYKSRPGRTLEDMRTALLELVGHLEDLRHAEVALHLQDHDGWQELVASVHDAERKADLRRAEDQVDAVLCAYLALFRQRTPERTTVYGDGETGYIVTPTLPEGHEPSPLEPRPPADPVELPDEDAMTRLVRTYAAGHSALQRATDGFVAMLTDLLDQSGLNYLSVSGRAKGIASFAAKAGRLREGRPMFADPLHEITDQIGLRVITYLRGDVDVVARVLHEEFEVLDDRDLGLQTASEGRFGYASRHLVLRLREGVGTEEMRAHPAQVQVRTVLQHAWAEFEHATRYKGIVPDEHVQDLDRRFTLAAGLLELADQEFSAIHERLQGSSYTPPLGLPSSLGIGTEELAQFLTERYLEAGWSRPDHYEWVSGLLMELGVTSVAALAVVLDTVDEEEVTAHMGYKYPPGAVRRLDDSLLAIFGERYLELYGNQHRADLLRSRLDRILEH